MVGNARTARSQGWRSRAEPSAYVEDDAPITRRPYKFGDRRIRPFGQRQWLMADQRCGHDWQRLHHLVRGTRWGIQAKKAHDSIRPLGASIDQILTTARS
jgi:hypothetical protein